MTLQPGQTLRGGQYRIERVLGEVRIPDSWAFILAVVVFIAVFVGGSMFWPVFTMLEAVAGAVDWSWAEDVASAVFGAVPFAVFWAVAGAVAWAYNYETNKLIIWKFALEGLGLGILIGALLGHQSWLLFGVLGGVGGYISSALFA